MNKRALIRVSNEDTYIVFTINGKRITRNLFSYFDRNKSKDLLDDFNKIDENYLFRIVNKSQKRRFDEFNAIDSLFSILKSGITTNGTLKFVKKFNCTGVFSKDFSKSIFVVKISKMSRIYAHGNYIENMKQLKFSDDEIHLTEIALLCFDDVCFIKSVRDYLPVIYRSNLYRYEARFLDTLDEARAYYERNKKQIENKNSFNSIRENFENFVSICNTFKNEELKNKAISNQNYDYYVNLIDKCENYTGKLSDYLFDFYYILNDRKKIKEYTFEYKPTRTDIVFYRGITNHVYELIPKIYRDRNSLSNEENMFREFKMRFPNEFNGKSIVDSVTLMQHYGCSTRLLDITTNPLVALFMACYNGFSKNEDLNKFGEVIIFYPEYIKQDQDNQVKFYDSNRVIAILSLSLLSYNEKSILINVFDAIPKRQHQSLNDFLLVRKKDVDDYQDLKNLSLDLKLMLKNAKKAYQHLLQLASRENIFPKKERKPQIC